MYMMTLEKTTENRATLTVAHNDFQKGMNSYAFFKINNRISSGDLVQDTFIKTWGYLVKGGKIDLMKAFLYHVLNGLIIDEYRKRKTSSLDELFEKGFDRAAGGSERMIDSLDGKTAQHLIPNLPEKYRKIMHMRHVQDLTLAEISTLTKLSKNTLAVQMHRGLEKLKALHNRT